jgi:MarR family 2-MHQ and catechol resistance regulon transcriptional repressor
LFYIDTVQKYGIYIDSSYLNYIKEGALGLAEELGFDRPVQTVEHESLLNIVYTGTMISRASFRYFQGSPLTDAQFNVLVQLKYAKERSLSQSALGRRLVVNKADMTGIIDRLEKAGLVMRLPHPTDRRVHMIAMTEKGERMADGLEPGYLDGVHQLMAGIPGKDLRSLMRTLEKVRRNIEMMLSSRRSGQ